MTVQESSFQDRRRTVQRSRVSDALGQFSERVTGWAGGSWAFALALLLVLGWAAVGALFDYSAHWQLFINTGTTIVTFLMVFLIQRSQNKESLAVQLKLNEIVAAIDGASNRLIDVETLTESELRAIRLHFRRLAEMATESSLGSSHSVEEAERRHHRKRDHAAGEGDSSGTS
ncbi:MAG TPA: low affinity iron permease family protein [Thermoanaerobaculia bacterium]|nr:low affinity iron permease family protein [Thermoanaerobaculia bacterium]